MPSVPGRPIVDGAGDPTPLTPQPDLQAGPRGSDLLEAVFQEAPLGMLLFDVSGRIIRANMAFADMLGSTPRLLQGRSLMDVLHPSDRERGREAISRVERDDRTWVSLQQRCLRDDGESRWGDLTIGTLGPRQVVCGTVWPSFGRSTNEGCRRARGRGRRISRASPSPRRRGNVRSPRPTLRWLARGYWSSMTSL